MAEADSITIAPPPPSPQNSNHEIHETTILSTFPRFDVVSAAPNDHHYKSNEGSLTSGAQKKIMREWKQLEKDLPDTIFVRAYEDKINLLRAVIVGASSTPKPPVHFEEFVKCFFKERAVVILSACEDYMNGKVKVGYYNTNSTAALRNVAVSGKFNGQMKVLIPLIATALNNVGASLGRFADYKVVVNEVAPKIKKEKVKKETKKKYKKNNKGFVKKLWEKLTMVFKSEKKTVKTTATGAITV
ncbi:hypothetical protein ACFE04_005409 [Oxalis oulophora]